MSNFWHWPEKVIDMKLYEANEMLRDAVASLSEGSGNKARKMSDKEIETVVNDRTGRFRGKYKAAGMKSGQRVKWNGKPWIVYDFQADSTATKGVKIALVSLDKKRMVQSVDISELSESVAGISSSNKVSDIEKKLKWKKGVKQGTLGKALSSATIKIDDMLVDIEIWHGWGRVDPERITMTANTRKKSNLYSGLMVFASQQNPKTVKQAKGIVAMSIAKYLVHNPKREISFKVK